MASETPFEYRVEKSGFAKEAQEKKMKALLAAAIGFECLSKYFGPNYELYIVDELYSSIDIRNFYIHPSLMYRWFAWMLERNFEPEEAAKCLKWVKLVTVLDEIPDKEGVESDEFYDLVHDGTILCKLINVLIPGHVNFESKMFQTSTMPAFQQMKERERIAMFLNGCRDYGVPHSYLFQTDALYEKTNLVQVLICLRALGMEAQSREDYSGPPIPQMWPKKAEEHKRNFTEEQMRAGESIIGLQMGTNKGANASGLSFGKHRII